MIPLAALLPNESYCRRCGGEGRVPSEDAYISSSATEPRYVGLVDCPADCADGIVAVENRCSDRPTGWVAAEFGKLRTELALKHHEIVTQQDQIDALLAENRRLREAVEKAARVIVTRAQFQKGA